MSTAVKCAHCDGKFFPEEGKSCDNCPVCGRTWYATPKPAIQESKGEAASDGLTLQTAPLPRGVEEEIKNLGVMGIQRTRNLAYKLVSHISDPQARLAASEERFKSLMACASSIEFDLECATCFEDMPCGHSDMWAYTEDGGKHIACLLCIRDAYEKNKEQLAAKERECEELRKENLRFAGMLESTVADWRKLYTEERAERVRVEGILMNDVQAERQESDEHINGLDTIIKTQDKTISKITAERDGYKLHNEQLTTAIDIKHQVVQTLVKWRNKTFEANRALCEEFAKLQASYDRRGRHMVRQSQHLHQTREKLRKVEGERDGHRERGEGMEKALRKVRFYVVGEALPTKAGALEIINAALEGRECEYKMDGRAATEVK